LLLVATMKPIKKHDIPDNLPDSDSENEDEQTEPEFDEHAQELSSIESMEVAPDEQVEETVDPDKEIVIKKSAPQVIWWKRRKIIIPAGIGLLVIILLLVPATRYLLVGWAWQENVSVIIKDNVSGAAVSDADVSIAGKKAITNSAGIATIKGVNVGYQTVHVEKVNYKSMDQPLTVEVFSSAQKRQLTFVATGRIVSVQVTDRLTNQPIADATIAKAASIYGRTDKDGRASVVVPANSKQLDITITSAKYKVFEGAVSASQSSFQLIPTGTMYFLSKQSGKIDVVKTNLDGTNRKVVVAGTGDENDQTTTLLAARDWKYLVLKSKRAPNKPESLFIINTADDSMKVIDEGNVTFTPIGWSGHSFMYTIQRQTEQYYAAKQTAIKSFNAENGNLSTLDENASDPASTSTFARYEVLGNYYIIDDALTYTKVWTRGGYATGPVTTEGKQSLIVTVRPDGTNRKSVKSFSADAVGQISATLSTPQEVYFKIGDNSESIKYSYGELQNGGYKTIPANDFDEKTYPTFLMSPNGNASFWSEERDGKNALFIGDKNAGGKQEIANASEFKAYGWLTDDWLLLQKQDSELYITTKDQLKAGAQPLKISDYHKVKNSLIGYGYGYGGL
jgi:hypothetical protein